MPTLVAIALLVQAPWRTDLDAARKDALAAGQPCIVLAHVDMDIL
jgi:hypothetical protein